MKRKKKLLKLLAPLLLIAVLMAMCAPAMAAKTSTQVFRVTRA